MSYTNYKHQDAGIAIGKAGSHAFFWDCGTGKTKLAIDLIKYWMAQGIGPAIVVCPLSIIEAAWIEDCRKFAPELTVTNLHCGIKNRKAALDRAADIYVINFEQFRIQFADLAKKRFGVIVVDESSKIKCHNSQVTMALLAMAGIRVWGGKVKGFQVSHIIPKRYVLSGTPAPNSEVEYWSQIKFVTGPGNYIFADDYYTFRKFYCHKVPVSPVAFTYPFKKYLRPVLMEKITPLAHVVRKDDVLDIPEPAHQVRRIYLSAAERKAYDTFKQDLVLQFADQEVLATTAIVEIMKLRQLTSGFAYTENGTVQVGHSKLTETKELLEEIGENQVIIWANFRHEIQMLLDALPGSQAIWSETVDRSKVIDDFQTGYTRYLIANPQSAAHGLTFVNCKYAIYFSLNYSFELHEQSLNRIHRIGQVFPVTYYYMVADKTLDDVIMRVIQKKETIANEVLNYLRNKK